jgi:hypothetical protein
MMGSRSAVTTDAKNAAPASAVAAAEAMLNVLIMGRPGCTR